MKLQLDIPDVLAEALGGDPQRAALEAMLARLTFEHVMSLGFAGDVLGLRSDDAVLWYERRGHRPEPMSKEQIESGLQTVIELERRRRMRANMTTELDDLTPLAKEPVADEYVVEAIKRALAVLADLMLAPDHQCTFEFGRGPLVGDVASSVNILLPEGCRATLESVASWRELLARSLPEFLPAWPGDEPPVWREGGAARRLTEGLTAWIVALLERLWPEPASAFEVSVDCDGLYEVAYVDIAVQAGGSVSLIHLGVSD